MRSLAELRKNTPTHVLTGHSAINYLNFRILTIRISGLNDNLVWFVSDGEIYGTPPADADAAAAAAVACMRSKTLGVSSLSFNPPSFDDRTMEHGCCGSPSCIMCHRLQINICIPIMVCNTHKVGEILSGVRKKAQQILVVTLPEPAWNTAYKNTSTYTAYFESRTNANDRSRLYRESERYRNHGEGAYIIHIAQWVTGNAMRDC
uniref:Uncharacterized protein n=1 Tax=Timema monikensis TaxID=170555 RepID=A0A7R9EA16_9NEOP|nr:unnamed protein product [Timema monikensis]